MPPDDSGLQQGLQSTQKIANDSLKKDDNNAKWELKQQVTVLNTLPVSQLGAPKLLAT